MVKILARLTSKYSNLQTAWDSVDPERQTVENLQERLIGEARLDTDGNTASVLAVTRQSRSKGNADTKKKKRRTKKNVECFRCQTKVHYSSQCPQKKTESGNSVDNYAVMVVATDTHRNREASSRGSSAHMIFRRDWFYDFRATTGDKVSLGDNGECATTGIGKILIERLVDGEWKPAVLEDVLLVPGVKKNLYSVRAGVSRGLSVQFKNDKVELTRN
ncbi:uncharacterized protein LOC107217732 [Neodiprion lecontei]|uniref:Uncharacterized protein LOC107217732 n=1 Tax=Neodiprion lecontei TaxID=441921 RepID=A0A6J0B767_NEOLC|nr:uncharacterized protein LOC107217732 [Neodiprion lecontei]